MVDTLNLIVGSDGWASRPRRGRGQRQHRVGILRERRNAIPSMRKECGMLGNLISRIIVKFMNSHKTCIQ